MFQESEACFPETDLLKTPSEELLPDRSSRIHPRMAKSTLYASTVKQEWQAEIDERSAAGTRFPEVIGERREYKCTDGTILYGHVVRLGLTQQPTREGEATLVPGILLFHTGGGPRDIFLHWKAYSLAADVETFGPGGCIVFIADFLSDSDGSVGWDDDKTVYDATRSHLLSPDEASCFRPALRSRINAAVESLCSIPGVDSRNLGAMGWCFGGQPIIELVLMKRQTNNIDHHKSMRFLIVFHGMCDGIKNLVQTQESIIRPQKIQKTGEQRDSAAITKVLICHGSADPYIHSQDMGAWHQILDTTAGIEWAFLQFSGVRHGFTNPAHSFHANQNRFGYDKFAASVSWQAARTMIKASLIS
mmetsp:Transcript_6674/g.9684  ORF Transcript_6674/g.9684 Transcript_6674/m.9684 type:complete len:361 (-) Transcript_6674:152-1234(-)|eukprot:CAMPEP_0172424900 /NCGR_PEP_ID=MMETSP1064-20121228/28705_1 /TAXON_ID=202472 /ORGANISM="Aulacoseira subarctica , Strain CCAP 1002/5" /LENGTH=360 /DNA_ID=CAMNT_0013167331 /DNA_START=8 /DNA_END=1090 /DNA_ORIENTATION=+